MEVLSMRKDNTKVTKGHQSDNSGTNNSVRGEKCLAKFTSSNGSVYGSITVDIRKAGDYSKPLPVAIRICHDGKKAFLRLGEKYMMDDWIQLCEYEKSGRRVHLAEREEMKAIMNKVKDLTNQLISEGSFSLQKLQERYQGKKDDSTSIYKIWDEYIQEKTEKDYIGTASVGRDCRNRFIKDNGENVEFADIDHTFIQEWETKMKNDPNVSVSYAGINLRTFRTIVNIAIKRNLINGSTKEMFKGTGYNKKASRKHQFLDVTSMRLLYDFWKKGDVKDKNGKSLYPKRVKDALFRDLGLFLFMYLGDGQNLADTLRLKYGDWYYATHGKQFQFFRYKTEERNEEASEVIFPVMPEIKMILDRHANEPKHNQRVFPFMRENITKKQEKWVIQRYNKNIRKHIRMVAELLGMEQSPSPTWARHSFATNLNNSGCVPYKYISDSMGHSNSSDITSAYIGDYPLKKMLEYNGYLLKESEPDDSRAALIELLKSMSAEERKKLMMEASKSE